MCDRVEALRGVGQSVNAADSHRRFPGHLRRKEPGGSLCVALQSRGGGICHAGIKRRETRTGWRMSGRVLNGKVLQLPAPQRAGRTMHFLSR